MESEKALLEYSNAFLRLFEHSLNHLSSDIDQIAQNLQREYELRQFHKRHLELGDTDGTPIQRLVGMGKKIDPKTNEKTWITDYFPSYFRSVVLRDFENLPLYKTYGITPEDAMKMPVDRYRQLIVAARKIPKEDPEDKQEARWLGVIEKLVLLMRRGGEGDA